MDQRCESLCWRYGLKYSVVILVGINFSQKQNICHLLPILLLPNRYCHCPPNAKRKFIQIECTNTWVNMFIGHWLCDNCNILDSIIIFVYQMICFKTLLNFLIFLYLIKLIRIIPAFFTLERTYAWKDNPWVSREMIVKYLFFYFFFVEKLMM